MTFDAVSLFIFAFVGGVIPPGIWLWFWLREDRLHPEPKPLIFATFIAGMLGVPVALFLEQALVSWQFPDLFGRVGIPLFIALFSVVIIEEGLKYAAALGVAFPDKNFDEPIDAMIYLITAALGFAALENTLFIIDNLSSVPGAFDGFTHGLLSGQLSTVLASNGLRFIGANVLHVIASGFLGAFIDLAFYRKLSVKITIVFFGILIVTFLHASFNFFIITLSENPLAVFVPLWALAILLIFLFERIKRITPEEGFLPSN